MIYKYIIAYKTNEHINFLTITMQFNIFKILSQTKNMLVL